MSSLRRLIYKATDPLESIVARLANIGRTVPREYRQYTSSDLLRTHRVAKTLRDGDEILDVGCGGGHLLQVLTFFRSFKRRVGIDVALPPAKPASGDIEMRVYDGQSLPFADRSFDAVIFGYVLHYLTPDHAVRLLSDACRVSRRTIIVLEDSLPRFSWLYRMRNRLERVRGDLLYAAAAGERYQPARNEKMFLTIDEWIRLLETLPSVRSVRVDRLDGVSRLVHHTLFEVRL